MQSYYLVHLKCPDGNGNRKMNVTLDLLPSQAFLAEGYQNISISSTEGSFLNTLALKVDERQALLMMMTVIGCICDGMID